MMTTTAVEMSTTTVEVPATAEGEADRGTVPVIVGIGLIVVRLGIVAVAS